MEENRIHIWHKCSNCGEEPINGIRYHCITCPAGPENDLCESCYTALMNGTISHHKNKTTYENHSQHKFVRSEGKKSTNYNKWLQIPQAYVQSPEISNGLLVRPEFVSGRDSFFGSHGFVVESKKGILFITALHVLDELIKKVSVDTTNANNSYTGEELPKFISNVNLYNVLQEKWMFYSIGTAGPMLVLKGARTDDEEPFSYRDIAAFYLTNYKFNAGKLANSAPLIGEPVWLAARVPGNGFTRQAVVVEKTEKTFIFRYLDSSIEYTATSGAPILNKTGEVVGINIGGGYFKNNRFGHANHVENMRLHLRECYK